MPRAAIVEEAPQDVASDSEPAIRLREVHVRMGAEDLYQGLSFDVRRGEFVCVLGPSGCGKSTLLRLISDLLRPTSGDVWIGSEPASQAWSRLAFIFQSPRLVPWRNALDNVLLSAELRWGRGAKRQYTEKARDLLRLVRLENDARKLPIMLSGGERQRVAIARALLVDPEILLMDEPFSALDLNTRERLRAELIRIWRETGRTIVFVTHDIQEAMELADTILLLSNKPTRILREIRIDTARPRNIAQDAQLSGLLDELNETVRGPTPTDGGDQ